jgi:hypothetical protein
VPSEKTVQTTYEMFLDKGIVGAVAVLAIAGLIWAVSKLLVSKDERIKDQTLFAAALQKTNDGVAALTVEVNKSAVAAVADASRSANAMVIRMQALEKSVEDMEREIGSLRDEQVRLVALLNSGGGGSLGGGRGRR